MTDVLSLQDFIGALPQQPPPNVPIAGGDSGTIPLHEFIMPPAQAQPTQNQQPNNGSAVRDVGMAAKGANDSIVESVGDIPDLVSSGMRAVGIPTPPSGFYGQKVKDALNAGQDTLGSVLTAAGMPAAQPSATFLPQNGQERLAYGAGHGAADAASVLVPAGEIARVAKPGSMLQGVAEGVASQPTLQVASGATGEGVTDSTNNAGFGTLAGLAVPLIASGGKRVISPVGSQLSPELQRLAGVAADNGINLSPGQSTGSKPVQTLENVLGALPFSSNMSAKDIGAQRAAWSKAILAKAGIDGTAATPPVLADQKAALGKQFENLSANTNVTLDNPFLTNLQGIVSSYGSKLPSQQREVFNNYVTDIMNSGNSMPGKTYQVTRSDLGRQANATANSDPALSHALGGLKGALDDAATRSIPPALADQWTQTRQQYANLKAISKAMGSGSSVSGNIDPNALWNSVKSQNPNNFPMGAGDLNDLARVGQAFLKPIPNSPTSSHQYMRDLVTASPAALGVHELGAGLPTAAAAGAASLALPPLVGAIMRSSPGRAYLTNQFAANGPQINSPLIAALAAQQARRMIGPQVNLGQPQWGTIGPQSTQGSPSP
jgi:hypothetical protein